MREKARTVMGVDLLEVFRKTLLGGWELSAHDAVCTWQATSTATRPC